MMTNQEIFDKVATHLIDQGVKAEEDGTCLYRLGDLKCAAGCILPDELYTDSLEGRGVQDWSQTMCTAIGISHSGLRLLKDLQITHDAYSVEHWPQRLRRVATEWVLNTDAIKKDSPNA